MDNFNIQVTGESREDFFALVDLTIRHSPGNKVEGYSFVDTPEGPTLVFLWAYDKSKPDYKWSVSEPKYFRGFTLEDGTTADGFLGKTKVVAAPILPSPFRSAKGAAEFAWNWLHEIAVYGSEPDHDGDNSKGFYLFTDFWGHVLGNHYGIVGIRPEWAMHGK